MAIDFILYMPIQRMWVRETAQNTISVRIPYRKVVGSRVKAKMVIESFPYMPIQRMSVWEKAKNKHFCTGLLCESCW